MADALAAVRSVLVTDAALTALVPAARILATDVLPANVALPAILVRFVSGVDLNILNPGSSVFTTKRVQIEFHAANDDSRRDVRSAVRRATLRNQVVTMAGIGRVVITTEAEGPDLFNEGNYVRVGIQDVKVNYSEQI